MSYPQPGVYHIQSSRHSECYASIRSGENVLRGEPFNTKKSSQRWRLDWVDNDSASDIPQFWCALTIDKGERQLSVNSVDDYQPIYSTDKQQSWFLKAHDAGYVVGAISFSGSEVSEYNWFLNNKDEPIIILGDKSEPQTWKFVPVD